MILRKSENRSPKRSVLTSIYQVAMPVCRSIVMSCIIFQILHGQGMSSQIDFGTGNGKTRQFSCFRSS